MKCIKWLTLITACGLASSALAVPSVPFGWYIEGNIGKSKISGVNYTGVSSKNKNGTFGWNVNAGYKFVPYFGLEGGYTSYAEQTISVSGVKVAKATVYALDLAAKAMLPLGGSGFEFFAKLGVAQINSKASTVSNSLGITASGSQTDQAMYYGLGADWSFQPNLSVNLQWARANGGSSVGTADLYSIGFNYIFT